MMPMPTFVMPGVASAWPARIEAACSAIEAAFGLRLDKASAYQEGHADVALDDRLDYLRKKAKTRTKWMNVFAGEGLTPTSSGLQNRDYYALAGRSSANTALYHCSMQYPEVTPGEHETLLAAVGDALAAHWGQYTPAATARRLRRVQWCVEVGAGLTKEEVEDLTPEERQLPWLVDTHYSPLERALQPGWLGWLNYWSPEVAEYLGFPDRTIDRDLLHHAHRTPAGAWLVKVGDAPLDASNPDHLALLARLYARFSRLGARSEQAPRLFRRTPLVFPSGLPGNAK